MILLSSIENVILVIKTMQVFEKMGGQKINYLKKDPLKKDLKKKVGHWPAGPPSQSAPVNVSLR